MTIKEITDFNIQRADSGYVYQVESNNIFAIDTIQRSLLFSHLCNDKCFNVYHIIEHFDLIILGSLVKSWLYKTISGVSQVWSIRHR